MICGRDVVNLDTFLPDEIRHVVERARALKRDGFDRPLSGRVLAMVFFDPSLRTRAAFKIAFETLGGTVIDMAATRDLWRLAFEEGAVMDGEADEHVRDAAAVLSGYADAIAIRALGQENEWQRARRDMVLVAFQKHATVPIFNMESVLDHPSQAWGDALTMTEALGSLAGRRLTIQWTPHPRARPLAVPQGVATMGAKLGMEVVLAHPPEFTLDAPTLASLERTARTQGGRVVVTHDPDEGAEGADVLYAAPWGSTAAFGNAEAQRAKAAAHASWRIDGTRLARAPGAHFMHAMPIRRGVEVTDDVVDSERSLVQEQAENRLHIQRALFCEVLGAG